MHFTEWEEANAPSPPSILSPSGRRKSKSPRPSITFSGVGVEESSDSPNPTAHTTFTPAYKTQPPPSIFTGPGTPRNNNGGTPRRPPTKKSISFRAGDFVLLTLADSVWGVDDLRGPDAFFSPHQRKLSLESRGVQASADSLQAKNGTSRGIKKVVTEDDAGVVVATVNSQMILSLDVDFPVNKHGRPEEVATSIMDAIEESGQR